MADGHACTWQVYWDELIWLIATGRGFKLIFKFSQLEMSEFNLTSDAVLLSRSHYMSMSLVCSRVRRGGVVPADPGVPIHTFKAWNNLDSRLYLQPIAQGITWATPLHSSSDRVSSLGIAFCIGMLVNLKSFDGIEFVFVSCPPYSRVVLVICT